MAIIPHDKMKRNSTIKAQWNNLQFDDGFHLRIRLMDFNLLDKMGNPYTRRDCISLQIGNSEGRYIAFISFPKSKLGEVISKLQEVKSDIGDFVHSTQGE